MKEICSLLNIEYFSDKINFWEKSHHTVGGNSETKYHSKDPGSNYYQKNVDFLEKRINAMKENLNERHRTIYYDFEDDPALEMFVKDCMKRNPDINLIEDHISKTDLHRDSSETFLDSALENGFISNGVFKLRCLKFKQKMKRYR